MDIGYGPDSDAARPDALTSYSGADWQIVAPDRRAADWLVLMAAAV